MLKKVRQYFTFFYKVLKYWLSCKTFYMVLQFMVQYCLILYKVLHDCSRLYKIVQDCSRFYMFNLAERGREGNSTMNPSHCIRNTGNSQNLFRVTLILFGAALMLSSEPLNLKSVKKWYIPYLILKTNSVDYHDACTLLLFVNSETLQINKF